MEISVGLVLVVIVAVVVFSFFRSVPNFGSLSEFFGEMESFRAMGELGEDEVRELLEDGDWEENLERAKREAEREGDTKRLEKLEKVEEMGPVMDTMAGNLEKGEVSSDRPSESTPSETADDEGPPPTEEDGREGGVEGTRPSPDEIPAECPQQYCNATWEEGGVLGGDGGKYEVLPNGQVRCTECGMIADIG